jgi:hypothetical protein
MERLFEQSAQIASVSALGSPNKRSAEIVADHQRSSEGTYRLTSEKSVQTRINIALCLLLVVFSRCL